MINVETVKTWVRDLAQSQGFYGRLYRDLNTADQWPAFVEILNENKISDPVDMVLFLES